jgi:hypothetical protein
MTTLELHPLAAPFPEMSKKEAYASSLTENDQPEDTNLTAKRAVSPKRSKEPTD